MIDQYTEIAKYYDSLVSQNRNYPAIAKELSEVIGNAKHILDIGIGTGLVVEHLLAIHSGYCVTGIDTSAPLLEQARERLGQKVDLYCQSVAELTLDKVFDAAYSRGGAWTFVSNESDVFLASHIFSVTEIQKSFELIAKHLKKGGLLIISTSNVYGNNLVELDNGVTHKRISKTQIVNEERYALFDYLFCKQEEVLARQELKLRLIDYQECLAILQVVGFVEQKVIPGKYYIFVKK